MNQVNILLCPYNYVLSPSTRKIIELNIENAIIVFDEAHNIENIAEDSCSRKLLRKSLDFTHLMKTGDT